MKSERRRLYLTRTVLRTYTGRHENGPKRTVDVFQLYENKTILACSRRRIQTQKIKNARYFDIYADVLCAFFLLIRFKVRTRRDGRQVPAVFVNGKKTSIPLKML